MINNILRILNSYPHINQRMRIFFYSVLTCLLSVIASETNTKQFLCSFLDKVFLFAHNNNYVVVFITT